MHDQDVWISQTTIKEDGRRTVDWIGTVAVDASLQGAPREALGHKVWNCIVVPRQENQSMESMGQHQQHGICRRAKEKFQPCRSLFSRTTWCGGCKAWAEEDRIAHLANTKC